MSKQVLTTLWNHNKMFRQIIRWREIGSDKASESDSEFDGFPERRIIARISRKFKAICSFRTHMNTECLPSEANKFRNTKGVLIKIGAAKKIPLVYM